MYALALMLLDSQDVNWGVVDVLCRFSVPSPHSPHNEHSSPHYLPHLQPQKQHYKAGARQNQTHQPPLLPLPPLLQPLTPA